MGQKRLGKQGLTVSAMGLGCMGMSDAYGPADEAESIATGLYPAIDSAPGCCRLVLSRCVVQKCGFDEGLDRERTAEYRWLTLHALSDTQSPNLRRLRSPVGKARRMGIESSVWTPT
jgi:hypothetical protein